MAGWRVPVGYPKKQYGEVYDYGIPYLMRIDFSTFPGGKAAIWRAVSIETTSLGAGEGESKLARSIFDYWCSHHSKSSMASEVDLFGMQITFPCASGWSNAQSSPINPSRHVTLP